MIDIEFIENPDDEYVKPIVDGVLEYGESLVGLNSPIKYASHLFDGKVLVGGTVGYRQFDRFYLTHIWVDSKHRGNGLGSKLLQSLEHELKILGCTSIILETLNERAVKFYECLGYSIISEIKEYVKGFDLVHLTKTI